MSTISKELIQSAKTLALALILSVGVSSVYAWTGPTATAPNGNADAPVNTGSTYQTKSGWLRMAGTGNGADPAMRIGVYDTNNSGGISGWWFSQNNDGKFAIHQNGVGDRLTIDGSGILGIPGTTVALTGGSETSYGAATVRGSKNGWSGLDFKDSAGSNYGTLMMHPSYSGFFNAADNNWRWYVTDTGNVYQYGVQYDAQNGGYYLDPAGASRLGPIYGDAFYYASDASLKRDVSTLSGSLEKILKLRGVSFEWKENGKHDIGFIAQEVEKVYPEMVSTNEEGLKSVQYGNLIAPLIEAIREQEEKIELQGKAIESLQKEIEILKQR